MSANLGCDIQYSLLQKYMLQTMTRMKLIPCTDAQRQKVCQRLFCAHELVPKTCVVTAQLWLNLEEQYPSSNVNGSFTH